MSGLTQALRLDGTSEGDIQALRPGAVLVINIIGGDFPVELETGAGVVEIEAEGEALLHTRTPAGTFGPGMPLHAGARYTYATSTRIIGFSAAEGTVVRVLEGA